MNSNGQTKPQVFTLLQKASVTLPRAEAETTTKFLAGDTDELGQLLERYAAGKEDPRIEEEPLPELPRAKGAALTITWESLTSPDGRDIKELFPNEAYPWH